MNHPLTSNCDIKKRGGRGEREKNKTLALRFQQNLNICWTHHYKRWTLAEVDWKAKGPEKKANQSCGKLVWIYCLLHEISVSRGRQTYCTLLKLGPQHRHFKSDQIWSAGSIWWDSTRPIIAFFVVFFVVFCFSNSRTFAWPPPSGQNVLWIFSRLFRGKCQRETMVMLNKL